jgi:glycerol-3-phosphate cytidylyltransferase
MISDKIDIWQTLKFDILFKGDDWSGTPAGDRLEREFAMVGVEVVYFPYTAKVSTTALRSTLQPLVGKIGEALAGARSALDVRSFEARQ